MYRLNNVGGSVSPNAGGNASFIAEIQDSIFSKSGGFTIASSEIHNAASRGRLKGGPGRAAAKPALLCYAFTSAPSFCLFFLPMF